MGGWPKILGWLVGERLAKALFSLLRVAVPGNNSFRQPPYVYSLLLQYLDHIEDGPLPVINGVMTPIYGLTIR